MKLALRLGALVTLATMLWASAEVTNFDGYSEASRIIIQWSSLTELNLQGYEIQRSMDNHEFSRVGFLEARGSNTGYTYVDDSVFAKISGRTYFYRLKIINKDGSSDYSNTITIESQINSVKHTWGSIKAMFK